MQTFLKSVTETENSSAENQTKEIILLIDCKTFQSILPVHIFDIENGSSVYQTKENICSMDCKTFLKDSNSYYFVLKSTKEIENSSAVYETKWIVFNKFQNFFQGL